MHLFALVGDPVRRRIIETLAQHEHDVGELTAILRQEFGISQPAVSHHLRVLRDAEFVTFRVDGPTRSYRLAWNALDRLDDEVTALYRLWDRRSGWPYRRDKVSLPSRPHRASRVERPRTTHDEIEPLNQPNDDDPWAFMRGLD
jgi:DNA-binding transcriptional ArsR family regulator